MHVRVFSIGVHTSTTVNQESTVLTVVLSLFLSYSVHEQ